MKKKLSLRKTYLLQNDQSQLWPCAHDTIDQSPRLGQRCDAIIQCVEGASKFVLFRHALSVLEVKKKTTITPLSNVSANCANGDAYNRVSVSDDGRYALLAGDIDLQLWDLDTEKQVATHKNKLIQDIKFLPGSHHALVRLARLVRETKDGPNHMVLFDADQHKLPKSGIATWQTRYIPKVSILVESTRVLQCVFGLYATVRDIQTGDEWLEMNAPNLKLPTGTEITPATASGVIPSSRSPFCALVHEGELNAPTSLSIWDIGKKKIVTQIAWQWPSHHGRIIGSLHPEAKYLALSGDQGPRGDNSPRVIRVINLKNNQLVHTWPIGSSIKTFSFLPNQTHALCTDETSVQLWDNSQAKPVASLALKSPITAWALSSSGQLAVATEDDKVHLFSVQGYQAPHGIDSTQAEHEVYSATAVSLARTL